MILKNSFIVSFVLWRVIYKIYIVYTKTKSLIYVFVAKFAATTTKNQLCIKSIPFYKLPQPPTTYVFHAIIF